MPARSFAETSARDPGTSWAFFLAYRENDVLSAQLYRFETDALVDPLIENSKGNRGAHVARDGSSVFTVLGGPITGSAGRRPLHSGWRGATRWCGN